MHNYEKGYPKVDIPFILFENLADAYSSLGKITI